MNNQGQKELIHEIKLSVKTNQNNETNSSTSGQPNFHCTSVALTAEVFLYPQDIRSYTTARFMFENILYIYSLTQASIHSLTHTRAQYHSTHIRAHTNIVTPSLCVYSTYSRERERDESTERNMAMWINVVFYVDGAKSL